MALKRLTRELKKLSQYSEFSCSPSDEDFMKWDVIIFGPQNTLYENGIFRAQLIFDENYPIKPPKFKFKSKISHPNIYLKEGTDQFNYEKSYERWSPQLGVASILLSIISILGEPNLDSAACLDTALLWRNNYQEMKKIIYQQVEETHK